MPGSSVSVANANIVLNTAVAEELSKMHAKLTDCPDGDSRERIMDVLKEEFLAHKRVLFNGNGYTEEWIQEAEKRGLPNLKSLPDAMPYWISEESIALFEKHHILTQDEIYSRYEILLENYAKSIHIESLTMQEMVRKDLAEGMIAYQKDLTDEIAGKISVLGGTGCALERHILQTLDEASAGISKALVKLNEDTKKAEEMNDVFEMADYYHKIVLTDMDELRQYADQAEAMIPEKYLSYPTYEQMLFSLR